MRSPGPTWALGQTPLRWWPERRRGPATSAAGEVTGAAERAAAGSRARATCRRPRWHTGYVQRDNGMSVARAAPRGSGVAGRGAVAGSPLWAWAITVGLRSSARPRLTPSGTGRSRTRPTSRPDPASTRAAAVLVQRLAGPPGPWRAARRAAQGRRPERPVAGSPVRLARVEGAADRARPDGAISR
jgi:hypothetical protein